MRPLSIVVVFFGFSVATALGQEPKLVDRYQFVYEVIASPDAKGATSDASEVAKKVHERLELFFSPSPEVVARDGKIEILIDGTEAKTIAKLKQIMETPCQMEFRILANKYAHAKQIELAEAKDAPTEIADPDDAKKILARWVKLDEGRFKKEVDRFGLIVRSKNEKFEALVVTDGYNVQGSYFDYVQVGTDEMTGSPLVKFGFTDDGAVRFADLTRRNRNGGRLGIIMDGIIFSAPTIHEPLGARAQITGPFTEEEIRTLAAKMKAGPLPAPLKLVKEGKRAPK